MKITCLEYVYQIVQIELPMPKSYSGDQIVNWTHQCVLGLFTNFINPFWLMLKVLHFVLYSWDMTYELWVRVHQQIISNNPTQTAPITHMYDSESLREFSLPPLTSKHVHFDIIFSFGWAIHESLTIQLSTPISIINLSLSISLSSCPNLSHFNSHPLILTLESDTYVGAWQSHSWS